SRSRIIYDAMFTHIMNALVAGEMVRLKGFGTFRVRQRRVRPRPDQSPHSEGAQSRNLIKFRPSKALKALGVQLAQFELESANVGLSGKLRNAPFPTIIESGNRKLNTTGSLPARKLSQRSALTSDELARIERERKRAQFDIHYSIGIAFNQMSLYEL